MFMDKTVLLVLVLTCGNLRKVKSQRLNYHPTLVMLFKILYRLFRKMERLLLMDMKEDVQLNSTWRFYECARTGKAVVLSCEYVLSTGFRSITINFVLDGILRMRLISSKKLTSLRYLGTYTTGWVWSILWSQVVPDVGIPMPKNVGNAIHYSLLCVEAIENEEI